MKFSISLNLAKTLVLHTQKAAFTIDIEPEELERIVERTTDLYEKYGLKDHQQLRTDIIAMAESESLELAEQLRKVQRSKEDEIISETL